MKEPGRQALYPLMTPFIQRVTMTGNLEKINTSSFSNSTNVEISSKERTQPLFPLVEVSWKIEKESLEGIKTISDFQS